MKAITPAVQADLVSYRDQYPILSDSIYLNSNSMGAMSVAVEQSLLSYATTWRVDGVEAWDTWRGLIDEVADLAAQFVSMPAGQTILNQNVAFFQASIASCLALEGRRNKVVIESLMFPSLVYVWERFVRRAGGRIELVASEDGMSIPTERMLAAIDEDTAAVVFSHGIYVSGALQDVPSICRRARSVGAVSVVDVYQTAGVVPIDATAWDADVIVGGSHKWLCGGPGTCFMWIRPELGRRLAPLTTGWMAHADPFAFESAPIRYADGPWRFMGGTPSVPAYYAARAAYQPLLEIGIERIRSHNLALSERIIERAQTDGLRVRSPIEGQQRAGFVAVDFDGSQQVCQQLIGERFKLDWRPDCGLRIGPHFYNTLAEVDALMDRIVQLVRR